MDMYLFCGQSNAAGYSTVSDWDAHETNKTFDGFWYGGQSDVKLSGEEAEQNNTNDSLNDFIKGITAGLGKTRSHIGPEFGFAERLESMYDAKNPAFIFKTAAGGTSILDTDATFSGVFGNWCPPSMRPSRDKQTAACGVMYDRFINNFTAVCKRLTEPGFCPRLKAVMWLQGETDRSSPDAYERHIKALISDMRADLGAQNLPFIISGISPTVFSYDTKYKNDRFNAMLAKVADSTADAYFIDNSADKTMWVNDENNIAIGTDRCHYNGNQMRELGKRFADVVIKNVLKMNVTIGIKSTFNDKE